MKFSSQEMSSIGLLVPISLISSALIMHLGLTSSAFGLISVIIAALAGGFLSGCLVSRIIRGKGSLLHPSWHIPLAGIMTALLAVIFFVCAMNMHDEFPRHSFLNKLFGHYHDNISPLHKNDDPAR
jgi:hypothetical protein